MTKHSKPTWKSLLNKPMGQVIKLRANRPSVLCAPAADVIEGQKLRELFPATLTCRDKAAGVTLQASESVFSDTTWAMMAVGAITIVAKRTVAVVAQNAKSIWKPVIHDPSVNRRRAIPHLSAMLSTPAAHVINDQKRQQGFSAASAFRNIVRGIILETAQAAFLIIRNRSFSARLDICLVVSFSMSLCRGVMLSCLSVFIFPSTDVAKRVVTSRPRASRTLVALWTQLGWSTCYLGCWRFLKLLFESLMLCLPVDLLTGRTVSVEHSVRPYGSRPKFARWAKLGLGYIYFGQGANLPTGLQFGWARGADTLRAIRILAR